jgi:hypothetical protein
MGDRSWPSDPWRRSLNGEHLSGACRDDIGHLIGAAPFRSQEEQGPSVRTASAQTASNVHGESQGLKVQLHVD